MKYLSTLLKLFGLILLIVLTSIATYLFIDIGYDKYINNYINKKTYDIDYNNIADNCRNLNLENTCNCLVDNVGEIYNYNITNLHRELTFNQLVEEGGVCWHYSNLYADTSVELGYNSYIIDILVEDNTYHEFAVVSNHEGYCLIDGINLAYVPYET